MENIVIFVVTAAPILSVYGLALLVRKSRLRRAAIGVGGAYVNDAWWRSGKIVGKGFKVEFIRARKAFFTRVDVYAQHTPASCALNARFFEEYPNWEHAKVLKSQKQRLFVVDVSIPGYSPAAGEERDVLWRWLNRGSTDRRIPYDLLTTAKVKTIYIEEESVSTNFRGIVSNVARLQSTIEMLRRLAADHDSRSDSFGVRATG